MNKNPKLRIPIVIGTAPLTMALDQPGTNIFLETIRKY
jgi:hypothetical protein